MARQFAIPETAPHHPRFADAFVMVAVTVLSLAAGAWFLLSLGLTLWSGTAAALLVYAMLLTLHLLVRRTFVFQRALRPQRDSWMLQAETAPRSEAGSLWARAVKEAREPPPIPPRDPFQVRPVREPSLSPPGEGGSGAPPRVPHPPKEASPEMSVEVIQDLIKKLADELNAVPSTQSPGPNPHTEPPLGSAGAPVQRAAAQDKGGAAPAREAGGPAGRPAREGAPRGKPGAEKNLDKSAEKSPPPLPEPQLTRIAEAVAAQRMEVLLEPIHALAEGRPRHAEVSVRLISADGSALDQGEVSRVVRGTVLTPRIDAMRMVRAARVARRLGDRGRQGSVLATIGGGSLMDGSFLTAAISEPASASMNLVLSFAQSEARAFSPGHVRALRRLATAGLRFALEEVSDLDMDFAALKDLGVDFVKLDAPVFLEGLPLAGGRVPASDVCRHLADFGLALIVSRIEDDWLLARVLGFGVLFGKGTLFGEPRVVKDEPTAAAATP
jgi:cyclic-di-GMP phosphodiesterase TipF (flagellum assembly factor)